MVSVTLISAPSLTISYLCAEELETDVPFQSWLLQCLYSSVTINDNWYNLQYWPRWNKYNFLYSGGSFLSKTGGMYLSQHNMTNLDKLKIVNSYIAVQNFGRETLTIQDPSIKFFHR